jgi:Family of unknown function (DUF5989)
MESFVAVWSKHYRLQLQMSGERLDSFAPPGSLARINLVLVALFNFFSERLWWWLTPAVFVVAVFISLAIFSQTSAIAVTPFMYTIF